MVFSSTTFLFLFLPLLLAFYYIPFRKSRSWKNYILLFFSIGFYAWGEPMFVFVMLFSVIVNWGGAICIDYCKSKMARKVILCLTIIFDVAILGVFKYASFISENVAYLSGNDSHIIRIALPIGISFFTFQMMSYVFDIYYGKASVQRNPLYVALYISLFPQLIAGPIVRYVDVENDILNRNGSFYDLSEGIKRFIYGLSKKMLLANFLAEIADNVFDYMSSPSVVMAWIGAICYTLQIYYDFSGYSDMAIGLGRMFGFKFNENFNYPYTADSVTDFWRRWHISLSSWFRDYVYIPLGGNRVNRARWVLNLFVVWLLTGIWHGANWTFLAWGLIYFAVLLTEKLTGFVEKLKWTSHIYTMIVVIIAWVFFRSESIQSAIIYVGNMFGVGSSGFADNTVFEYLKGTYVVLIIAIIGCTNIASRTKSWVINHKVGWLENVWLLFILAISIFEVVSATYNPFIYFNF